MQALDFTPSDTERTAQQRIVLTLLKQRPATTLCLRRLGVASPAARVLELRRQGWPIVTGRVNRFACYYLRAEEDQS